MNNFILGIGILFLFGACNGSISLPEPVTNNAVVALRKNNKTYLYSFYGLDSTKKWSGVHNKIYKVDLENKSSTHLGNVPDEYGRLASSASVVRNQAYIVGGYAVLEDGTEKSSSHLFIFHPDNEQFTKGAPLPIPIDDQAQAVWRDSLLYVISGWSDSINVNSVQVYNPALNTWKLATPLPDDHDARVFGGVGTIVGDTIYFLGGARFEKFYSPSKGFFKGAINPKDPYTINWFRAGEYPGEFRYRSGVYSQENEILFIGGSNETYNYNGISYAMKKPVEPNQYILVYNMKSGKFSLTPGNFPMDLRNVVPAMENSWFVVGGMFPNQKVSNQVITVSRK